MKHVAVVGPTGYAGRELCELVVRHPRLALELAMSAREDGLGEPVVDGAPPVTPLASSAFGGLDAVFLCTPHGVTAPLATAALEAGCTVIDLSADFRLKDVALWERTYGATHPAPELCDAAVYGLTEHARDALPGARLVANPGCYPTAVLLGVLPALRAGLVDPVAPLVADCKSGVSGAGKAPSRTTHFGDVHENFRAYGVGAHRHAPEIHQGAGTARVVFVPHLLPCFRGILATLYLVPAPGVDAAAVRASLRAEYDGEPFVRVLEDGLPALADVQRTNRCHLGVADAHGVVVVVSALDNLVKGAAGQALQNLNAVFGFDETEGLA